MIYIFNDGLNLLLTTDGRLEKEWWQSNDDTLFYSFNEEVSGKKKQNKIEKKNGKGK